MRPPKPFLHPRTERLLNQIGVVLREGVLAWGVPFAVIMSVIESYRRDVWVTPREFVQSLIVWGLTGVTMGLLRLLRRRDRRDDTVRCPECGEALPIHTTWCTGEVRSRRRAANA